MKQIIKQAFVATVPVLTGYIVLGFGFGIILKTNGYGIFLAFIMSLLIYAGSMQYVAIGLLTGGASLITIAITTLMVNARHLFYGISMLDKYKGTGLKKWYLIFGMCDESFSINYTADIPENVDKGWFMIWVTVLNQFYWVLGAMLGGLFGSFIQFNTEGLEFVMTALFVVIFLEQWLKEKNHTSAIAGLVISVLCLIFFGKEDFIIPAMLGILGVMTLLRKPLEKGGSMV